MRTDRQDQDRARTTEAPANASEPPAVSDERIAALKDKIFNYKQVGRLDSLASEINVDPSFSDADKAQVGQWIGQRKSQLTGQLPLG